MGYTATYIGPRLQVTLKEHLANKERIKKRLQKFEENNKDSQ